MINNNIVKKYFSTPSDKFAIIENHTLKNDVNYSELCQFLVQCKDPEFRDNLINDNEITVFKNSRSTLAFLYKLSTGNEVFIKIYRRTDFKYQSRYIFRASRAVKSFKVGKILQDHNITTPTPILSLERRKLLLLKYSVVVNEAIKNVMTCGDLFDKLAAEYHQDFFEQFLNKSMEIIANFHVQNIIHGDLKISNLYYIIDDNKFTVGLWDFDGSKMKDTPLSANDCEIDVGRFVASLIDGLTKRKIVVDDIILLKSINNFYRKYSKNQKFDILIKRDYIKKLRKTC